MYPNERLKQLFVELEKTNQALAKIRKEDPKVITALDISKEWADYEIAVQNEIVRIKTEILWLKAGL